MLFIFAYVSVHQNYVLHALSCQVQLNFSGGQKKTKSIGFCSERRARASSFTAEKVLTFSEGTKNDAIVYFVNT